MNDKFDNQDLEKFFHDKLDQYGDEPGEEFWAALEPMIPPPPKKRRRGLLLWWFFGGLLLVALGGYVWANQKSLSLLEEKMLSQEQEIEVLKNKKEEAQIKVLKNEKEQEKIAEEKIALIEKSTIAKNQNQSQSQKENRKDQKPHEIKTNQSETIKTEDKKAIKFSNERSTIPLSSAPLNATPLLSETSIVKQEQSAIPTVVGEADSEKDKGATAERLLWNAFDFLDIKRDSLVALEKEERPELVPPIVKPQWEPRLGIGVFYESWFKVFAPGYVEDRVGTEPNASYTWLINVTDLEFTGHTFGVNFQIPLAEKWELGTGIALTKFGVSSTTQKDLEIDLENAVERPGDFLFNNYFYNIESFLGRTYYETGLSYRLAEELEDQPMQGDTFSISVNENIALDYLYIPLHLKYLLKKGKWGGKIGLGLDFYHLVNVDLKSSATGKLQGGEDILAEDVVASEDIRLVGLRNIFLGARGSLGANYSFAKNWNLSLDAGYHFGIRSIAAHEKLDLFPVGFNAKINYLTLRLGIHYQF